MIYAIINIITKMGGDYMKKRILSAMLVFAVIISLCAFFAVNINADKNEFASELIRIYQKYDGEVKSNSEFALKRLILSDYNGKNTYGAADWAFDKKHSLAVLQYESEEQAKSALKLIEKDNIAVDCDSYASLNSVEKGTICPEASSALGTSSYISRFSMAKDDVIVAVIDTGVMLDHEYLANRFVSGGYDFSDNGSSNAYYDTSKNGAYYGHGTFVCGIIADNTPDNVKILPYKAVAFGDEYASNSAIVAAIYDAVDKGASVINISLSSSSGANAFKFAVQTALSKNVCICASAGNESKEIKYRYPASTPGVITVSAVDNDYETLSYYSNFGKAVDFCAPGGPVTSTCPYTEDEKRVKTNRGTSFSSPYVAAICADIKSVNNSLTKEEVYSVIRDFSKDLGDEGYDIYFGNGFPDIGEIVYSDNESYSLKIPEGILDITDNPADYTAETQPWKLFADRVISVNIDKNVDSIGDYAFYNMKNARFNMPQNYKYVGEGAFYSCTQLSKMRFDEKIGRIGDNAFGDIGEDFCIYGYKNTPAESYALKENIKFIKTGCKHSYLAEVVEPDEFEEGFTIYTCTACGDTYIGDYIKPPEYYEGECGTGVTWKYTVIDNSLVIDGEGYMNEYLTETAVPWYAFMEKIKTVSVGENVKNLSSFILVNAKNAEKLTVNTKTAVLCDKTVIFSDESESKLKYYVFEDSAAKDYLKENSIDYISLGCGHSRNIEYSEEEPSCCFDTYGVYTCADCSYSYSEYISRENKGHYFSGAVSNLSGRGISGAEIYIDGTLSAISNNGGRFAAYPVLCGKHSVQIKKHGAVLESYEINVDKTNLRSVSELSFGDIDSNGYVNAKDYAIALKNGFDDVELFNYGEAENDEISYESYENQRLPFAAEFYNIPRENNDTHRDFIAVVENKSEFAIKESGFIYGKNMTDDMLYLDFVGSRNSDGYVVKKTSSSNNSNNEKVFGYGSSTKEGTLSARFYIIYTNGVFDFTCYSEVSSYTFPDKEN